MRPHQILVRPNIPSSRELIPIRIIYAMLGAIRVLLRHPIPCLGISKQPIPHLIRRRDHPPRQPARVIRKLLMEFPEVLDQSRVHFQDVRAYHHLDHRGDYLDLKPGVKIGDL